jgi:hypothetical protein
MSECTDWHPAFLAFSVLLGEPLEAAAEALGDAGAIARAGLAASSRGERAAAVARVVAGLVAELERSRLA